ncbi:MAG: hypothetical protein ACI8RD_003873 [Bacillariaceae sp.]|jgi:hypothetical protein
MKWSMPHPAAYIFVVSKDVTFLKTKMKEYCVKIKELQIESDGISKKLFSRKPSKTLAIWARRLEVIQQEEELYRASFQLARFLWQLECILIKTYIALTKWRRCKDEKDKSDKMKIKNNNSQEQQQQQPLLQLKNTHEIQWEKELQRQQDEDNSAKGYEQCGYDQATASKEICKYLNQSPCDFMIQYVAKNYCACLVCNYYFNKKDLGIFGLIRVKHPNPSSSDSSSSSSSNSSTDGDNSQQWISASLSASSSLSSSTNDAMLSTSSSSSSRDYKSFYCLECYKKVPTKQTTTTQLQPQEHLVEGKENSNATTTVSDTVSDTVNTVNTVGGGGDNTSSNNSNNNNNNNNTHTTKKRRKKKKKKNSPPPEKEISCSSPISVIDEQCVLIEKDEKVNEDNDDIIDEKQKDDDSNDFWVDYLLKTGSIIALNHYMDEVLGMEDSIR